MFPQARLVHVLRDGRDVVASILNAPWREDRDIGKDRPTRLRDAAMLWRRSVTAGLALQNDPRVTLFRYEDFVEGPVPALKALFADLSLSWHPSLDSYLEGEGGRVFSSSVGRWRDDLSADDLAIITSVAGELIARVDCLRKAG